MNIREDIAQLKTGKRDLRKFGWMVGGVLVVLGVLLFLRHKSNYPYFFWPGIVLLVFAAIYPAALKQIYIGWMTMAFVLGFIVSHVILTLFFFLIITPIGLIARLFRRDFLSLKLDRQSASYWIQRHDAEKTLADYERQF
jgi:hypothetical protein